MASRLAGWQCMTTRFWGSTLSRATWLIIWAGNSEVNLPPSSKPQRSSASVPFPASRTRPRFTPGAYWTFLKYLPVPVTRKYLPSNSGASNPVGMVRRTRERFRYSCTSASSSSRLMLPPLRSSQPWLYMLVVVRIISTTKGAVRMSFMSNLLFIS